MAGNQNRHNPPSRMDNPAPKDLFFVPEELQNIVEDAVPEWPRHKQYAAAKDLMSMLREMLLKKDKIT